MVRIASTASTVGGLILSILLVGCVSTRERYERGLVLEEQGRYAEAARYYIDVLKREPEWERARAHLATAGAQALADYWRRAEEAEAGRDFEAALRALRRLERLAASAGGVGVDLAVPPELAAYRKELRAAAFQDALDRAEAAERAGSWRDALAFYERAERHAAGTEQEALTVRARARVYLRWGERLLASEAYRAAYERAGDALEVLEAAPSALPGADLRAAARELQEDALAAGTTYAVLLPVEPAPALADRISQGAVGALNDRLLDAHWSRPPLFVAAVDPLLVRRELRRFRHDRAVLRRSEVAEIGRVLDADVAVQTVWETMTREEAVVDERVRPARTRGRAARDTTYVEQDYVVEVRARARYVLVDPYTARVDAEGLVEADADRLLRRGLYAGAPETLQLSRDERRLFDDELRRRAERDLEDDLIDRLAERLAREVYEALLRRGDAENLR